MSARWVYILGFAAIALALAAGALVLTDKDPVYRLSEIAGLGSHGSQDALIAAAAARYNVDPLLVKAVIWQESRFQPEKLGAHGERGVMQVTEPAAQEGVQALDVEPFVPEDLLDPKWKDAVNVKVSNSGLQHATWFVLKPILAKDYFDKFGLNKPRAFDSYVQQYGRLVDGQDKVIMAAQYSGFIEFKAKGAPVAFVFPAAGAPATQQSAGVVADAPHPNAAELFLDWYLSPVGQRAYADVLFNHSPREDVGPPPGGVPIKDIKVLVPQDTEAYEKSRPEFAKEWDKIVGARK
jgi:spermidine/putrescine-binding protein